MFLGTADGRVTDGNVAWNRLVGNGRSGRVARWDDRTDPAADPPPAFDTVAHADVTFRRSGGPDVTGHRFVVRLSRDEVFGVFLDQSAVRRTEDELRRENEGLNEADVRKDEALAILAHELRNPLAPIKNAAELVRRVTTVAERDRWSRVIETQVEVLVRLVDDLLDVTRIRRGKVEIRKVTIDLAELVAAAAESIRPLMDQRRHDFFVGVPAEGPVYVEADPQRMAQVLNNLLTNAARFSPKGKPVAAAFGKVGSTTVIEVRDQGIGIPENLRDKVFERFYRADNSRNRETGGSGLGLSIVSTIVARHNGTIVADQTVGGGATFRVTLPLPSDKL